MKPVLGDAGLHNSVSKANRTPRLSPSRLDSQNRGVDIVTDVGPAVGALKGAPIRDICSPGK